MATHSNILAWRIPMDRGAWRAAVHGVAKSRTGPRLSDCHGSIEVDCLSICTLPTYLDGVTISPHISLAFLFLCVQSIFFASNLNPCCPPINTW